jgi:hypothetical protein
MGSEDGVGAGVAGAAAGAGGGVLVTVVVGDAVVVPDGRPRPAADPGLRTARPVNTRHDHLDRAACARTQYSWAWSVRRRRCTCARVTSFVLTWCHCLSRRTLTRTT